MYYNGTHEYDVAQFLGIVHKQLIDKYELEKENTNELRKAKVMTKFLSNFKRYNRLMNVKLYDAAAAMGDIADVQFYEDIRKVLKKHQWTTGMFDKEGITNSNAIGAKFEQEMGALLGTIATGSSANRIVQKIVSGKDKTYSSGMSEFLSHVQLDSNGVAINAMFDGLSERAKQALLEEIVPKTQEKEKKKDGSEGKKLRQVEVYAKTDLNASQIQMTAEWRYTEESKEAINYLLSSTFTAKSYDKNNTLGFGATSSIRRYFTTLEGLGYTNYTTNSSSFVHALNLMYCSPKTSDQKERDKKIRKYIHDMNFIYEIRGSGQQSLIKQLYEADYLVYNPNTEFENIYVIPTKYILSKMMKPIGDSQYKDNPFISKDITLNQTMIKTLMEGVNAVS